MNTVLTHPHARRSMLRLHSARFSVTALPLLALTLTGAHHPKTVPQAAMQVRSDSGSADTTVPSVTFTPAQGSLVSLLTTASKTARSRSLTPVLDIGATWCGPCQVLNDLFASAAMRPAVQHMYLIHLDLDLWHDALDSLGVDVNTGIPRVQALDAKGLPSGEPWRPRDVPDSLTAKGTEEGWRLSLQGYFENARKLFAQAPAGTTASAKQTH